MNQKEIFKLLKKGSFRFNISLKEEQVLSFYKYLLELRAWGRKMNLISRSGEREIVIKDFLDSLSGQEHIFQGASLLDLGSGAGFPGGPLKIVRADLKVVLLELMQKKVYFLKNLIRVLALEGIEIYRAGEKETEKNLWGEFDFVISRAFGSLEKFAAAGLPFLKPGGILLAMKGKKGEDEMEKSLPALMDMGLTLSSLQYFSLPFLGHQRILIRFQRG
jgi:16S rRNA (guanine527-N7)-methyltransferase